jgi:beta-N-acetylhexosaminidase
MTLARMGLVLVLAGLLTVPAPAQINSPRGKTAIQPPDMRPAAAQTPRKPAATRPKPPFQPSADRLDVMIGQMLIFGFSGTRPDQPGARRLAAQLGRGEVGGVIFLGRNVKGFGASAHNIQGLTRLFAETGGTPFIMVDQEGGQVARLSTKQVGFLRLPAAAQLAKKGVKDDKLHALYLKQAKALKSWGFNVNLAPVVDLNINPNNPIIGKLGRAYSNDPVRVSAYAAEVIRAHRAAGVLTALKHFPGHGSSLKDSHKGFTDITATWREIELQPYKQLIKLGMADMIMVGHLHHGRYQDNDRRDPATLSKRWIAGVLRRELGFRGVVVSDDMQMRAITKFYKLKDALIRAIEAGVDLLIVPNNVKPQRSLPLKIRAWLTAHAETNPKFRARIEASYARILQLKKKM